MTNNTKVAGRKMNPCGDRLEIAIAALTYPEAHAVALELAAALTRELGAANLWHEVALPYVEPTRGTVRFCASVNLEGVARFDPRVLELVDRVIKARGLEVTPC